MYTNELYHYGVKGMKWGVRRTPEQLGHRIKKYTSPTREALKSAVKRTAVQALAYTIPGFGMAWNAYATGHNLNNLRRNLDGKDYTAVEGAPEKLSELKRKKDPSNILDDMKQVNPNARKRGGVKNCMYCTMAMEMRRRGYDVRARKKAQGCTAKQLHEWFDGGTIEQLTTERRPKESRKSYINRAYDELCTNLEKYGNGARGSLFTFYEKINSGHATFWEVQNGRVNFYDGQVNEASVDKVFSLSDPSRCKYMRLDTCTLKENVTETVISKEEKRGGK